MTGLYIIKKKSAKRQDANMNVVPQYKVIGPYNYDRIVHNKKKSAKRQDIVFSCKSKDAFDFEDKNLFDSLNTLKVKHVVSYLFCSW